LPGSDRGGCSRLSGGVAGRHTRSSKIEGTKLATAGPYAHVNPIYLGIVVLGFGMVLLIGDRRLLVPCAITFLAFYLGLIPAEEEFFGHKFQQEYEAYRRHVPRLLSQLKAWAPANVAKTRFDRPAADGEWRFKPGTGSHLGAVPSYRPPKNGLNEREISFMIKGLSVLAC
jgi:hypothetical protein